MAVREHFIDELRGVAMLGIAIANAPAFAYLTSNYSDQNLIEPSAKIIVFLVLTLITSKFYSIFAFLFGYSTAFTTEQYTEAGIASYRRRLVLLGLFGIAHGSLLFFGDIVSVYVLVGIVLPLFFKASKLKLIAAAVAGIVITATISFMAAVFVASELTLNDKAQLTQATSVFVEMNSTGFWNAVVVRMPYYFSATLGTVLISGLQILSMFLLGLLAVRQQWFSAPCLPFSKHYIWLLGLPALLIAGGFAATLLSVGFEARMLTKATLFAEGLHTLATPVLALMWIFSLRWLSTVFPSALFIFRATGRASLSCYLLQSCLFSAIFASWAMGYVGQFSVFQVLLVSLAVWFLCTVLLHLWLKALPQGPLETILSKLLRK